MKIDKETHLSRKEKKRLKKIEAELGPPPDLGGYHAPQDLSSEEAANAGNLSSVPTPASDNQNRNDLLKKNNQEMNQTSSSKKNALQNTKVDEIQQQLDEVSEVMESNINKALQRGESLESITMQLDDLQASSTKFKQNTTTVKKKLWWKDVRCTIITTIVILLIIGGAVGYFAFMR